MKDFKQKIFLGFVAIIFITIFLAEDFFIRQKSRIIFCDVGQGDGVFVTLAGGTQLIFDGGPDNKLVGCVGHNMPYFDNTIEYVIISHPDRDHFVGVVELLRRYNVKNVILNGDTSDIPEYQEFIQLAGDRIDIFKAGDEIDFYGGKVDFFHPSEDLKGDSNYNSLVAKLVINSSPHFQAGVRGGSDEFSILFTGDASIEAEELMIKNGADLKSDILKVGHHGSKTSTSEEFLYEVNPDLAIISVSADNKYGHPSYLILRRLERMNIPYKRTDEEGDIIINF